MMPKIAGNRLQKAVYDSLKAISGLGAEIYAFVPQNAAYPYVRIGAYNGGGFDTKNTFGADMDFLIHIFDKSADFKRSNDIADKIYNRLHFQNANLIVEGFAVVNVYCENISNMIQSNQEGGEKSYHTILRFTVQMEEIV